MLCEKKDWPSHTSAQITFQSVLTKTESAEKVELLGVFMLEKVLVCVCVLACELACEHVCERVSE